MAKRKWLTVELSISDWRILRRYLRENNIKYEPSTYVNYVYVSMFVNDTEREQVNKRLEEIYNARAK